jgi:Na+/H+ antiporter NhaD/arsenite permease-like protein
MSHDHASSGTNRVLVGAIALVLAIYLITAIIGVPQKGTEMIAKSDHSHAAENGEHATVDHEPHAVHDKATGHDIKVGHDEKIISQKKIAGEEVTALEGEDYGEDIQKNPPPYWMVTWFALLLGAIAVFPLMKFTEEWWESNTSRFLVAALLGLITLLYYLFLHNSPIDGHFPVHYVIDPIAGGPNWGTCLTVFANAILNEYIPFIMLLFALYTICGGIRISGDLKAHSMTNTTIIGIGGLLASFIGTTGAAMLLIRPLLETNRERKHVVHTVVFFIFVVCNCGGCLLPIGDPPLFLGYLRGVDFTWTFNLWPEWLFVNTILLVVYFLADHFHYYKKELPLDIALDETENTGIKVEGLWPNALLLLGVILSVAFLDPHKPLPGTDWRPWVYMREAVQAGLILTSLVLGSKRIRHENNFNYHAILEVAALFSGIFICMQPALQILGVQGPELGLVNPMQFFWSTGGLSAVLDNAPTYVVFFETAQTLTTPEGVKTVAGINEQLLIAISLGAVFMGAMTYIGNGPNFMVKAIAEKSGVKMPSFFGYMVYSCLILLPILVLTTFLFL